MTVTRNDGGYSKELTQSNGQKKIGESTMKLDRGTTDYLRAMSFDVVVEVVYRRTRRIRARNKLEAKEMARDRELNVASKRYDKMNKIAYEVKNVSAIKATPSGRKQMTNVKDLAYNFEAVQVALRKDKNGYNLVLCVHPDDVPVGLLRDRVGTRYGVAMVRINDQEEIDINPTELEGQRLVKSAIMSCKEPEFWEVLMDEIGESITSSLSLVTICSQII